MKAMRFTIKEHEEHGGLGLTPKWYPNGDPLGGMAAAHDILEHFPHDNGDTEGEMQAFGAMIWVREEGGYGNGYRMWSGIYDIGTGGMRDEWQYHHERHNRGPDDMREPPACRDREVRARMMRIVHKAKWSLRSEMSDDEEPYMPSLIWWKRAAGWMAHGYQRAKKRYYRHAAHHIAWMFARIEEACDKIIEHADEGMELIVHVNLRRGTIRIEYGYPKEPGYDHQPERHHVKA